MLKFDLAVVGGGPAGMSAALYACENGKQTILFEGKALGGQMLLTPKIENYPGFPSVSGAELAFRMEEQLKRLGCKICLERVSNIHKTTSGEFKLESISEEYIVQEVIYAAGAKPRKLRVPGEVDFLGRGVSYCATCDGSFFRGQDVAVVGGGNSALEEALQLSAICRTVYLIHRKKTFNANQLLQRSVANTPNVLPVMGWEVKGIQGGEKLHSLRLKRGGEDEEKDLIVSGLFIAIGRIPESDVATSLLTPDENGYLPAGENGETDVPGFYVVGDCRKKTVRQIVGAVSDGASAVLNAIKKDHLKVGKQTR